MQRCVVHRIINLATREYAWISSNKVEQFSNGLTVQETTTNCKRFQTFVAGGLRLVTGEHYIENQLGVVIPAGAVVPDNILEEMWLKDKLSGKKRNIVKAKPMFGYPSEGLFYGQTWMDYDGTVKKALLWNDNWKEGDDVTDELGITFKNQNANT